MAAPRKCLERARSCRLGTHSGLRCSWSLQLDSAVPSQRPRGGMKEGLWCWEVGSSPKRDLKEGGGSCPEGGPKSAQWVWGHGSGRASSSHSSRTPGAPWPFRGPLAWVA